MTTQHVSEGLAALLDPIAPGKAWSDHPDGLVILEGYLPDALLDAYTDEWRHAYEQGEIGLGGWDDCTPYMRFDALRALCVDYRIARALQSILHEPAGVHLNLTGFVSTERSWHQDGYLNPPEVGDSYAAVWIALDDIDEDAGPFEWIPGSHEWGRLTREKILDAMGEDGSDPLWPSKSERVLDPLIKQELEQRGNEVGRFTARKGDVLIWHPRLFHRGSRPANDTLLRPALIAHYSGVMHRPDMPTAVHVRQWDGDAGGDGGWYFPLESTTPVR